MKRIGGYEVLRELPRGRAGPRYVASNPRSDETGIDLVALTLLDVEWVRDPAYLTILNAEAEAAIHFSQDAAVRVLEVNRVDDAVAIAMELVNGKTLAEVLERTAARSTRMHWTFFVWVGVQIAKLLQIAHATPWADGELKGMYHGQLCPADVYLTYDGRVKVNGVGLGRSRARLPLSSARLPYHAPELFDRHKADHLTDVYGLGIVLNDAIRGRTTFSKETDAAMRRAIVTQTVPPIHLDVPGIPSSLASLLGHVLAKMPTERPSSLFEIERTLQTFLDHGDEHYREGIASHMTSLFKSSARATPPPPVMMLREPPPIDAPPDEPWVAEPSSPRMSHERPVDDGFVDEMAVEELVEAIVAQRVQQTAPGFTSTRPRAVGVYDSAPRPAAPAPRKVESTSSAPGIVSTDDASFEPRPKAPPPPKNGGAAPNLLEALDAGSSINPDFLVEAIVAGAEGASRPVLPPADRSNPPFEFDDDDSGFEIERNETPFPPGFERPSPEPPRSSSQPESPWASPSPTGRRSPSQPESPWAGTTPTGQRSASQPESPWASPTPTGQRSSSQPESPWASPPPKAPRPLPPFEPPGITPKKSEPPSDLLIEDPVTMPPYVTPPEGTSAEGVALAVHRLAPGDVVADRYRIHGLLGEGGVSVVYRAEHMLLGKQVALKVMRPELSNLPSAQERFQLEARSVSRLDHPNIVRVTDFGHGRDGRMFLVMDVVEGESLAALLRREGVLGIRQGLWIVRQLLGGLRHAHDAGVVHRDLKPENVIITERDGVQIPKILDFGIAKITDQEGQRSITQAGTVFGTPRYMSPEQAAGEQIDLRTDIYTVGVILYQMLTGRIPFDGTSTVQILSRVLTQPPPPMRLEHPDRDAARAIEELVMRALEKERDARFADTTDFDASIEAISQRYGL